MPCFRFWAEWDGLTKSVVVTVWRKHLEINFLKKIVSSEYLDDYGRFRSSVRRLPIIMHHAPNGWFLFTHTLLPNSVLVIARIAASASVPMPKFLGTGYGVFA
jgi:hypothetical protein